MIVKDGIVGALFREVLFKEAELVFMERNGIKIYEGFVEVSL